MPTWRVDPEEQAELNRRVAAEKAALANINPEGGYFHNLFEQAQDSLGNALSLFGVGRTISGQKVDPNRDPNYHGETALNDIQETLSNAAKTTSNFLEQHESGRNLKSNLSNLAIRASDTYDYLIDESDRGGQSTPGEWGAWALGSILRDREKHSQGAADLLGQLKINGQSIDPRILKGGSEEVIDTLLTLGIAPFAKGIGKGISTVIDNAAPPGAGSLVPVGVADDLRIKPPVTEVKPSNVFEMNAANPRSHVHDIPTGFKGSESVQNRAIANKELDALTQVSTRHDRAAKSTNWLRSSLTRFNRKVGQSLDNTGRAIAEPHHVADHALVGDINLAIGNDRANTLFKALNAKDLRTGNDGYQMINIPGTASLGTGARHDHMKLIHKTWYPQIETRKILTNAIKDGTIKDKKIFSDKRIAGLLSSTIRQQQEITIGWAKWKLDKVRKLYPKTNKLNPQQMRTWLQDHPYEFSVAGAGEAPEHFSKITKYGATKGQGNYTNNYLRTVFGLEYNPRTLGRSHAIPAKDRLTPEGKIYR